KLLILRDSCLSREHPLSHHLVEADRGSGCNVQAFGSTNYRNTYQAFHFATQRLAHPLRFVSKSQSHALSKVNAVYRYRSSCVCCIKVYMSESKRNEHF